MKLFCISGICDINKKRTKDIGCCIIWTLLDTKEHRMIMATRCKFSGLLPLPNERLVSYE